MKKIFIFMGLLVLLSACGIKKSNNDHSIKLYSRDNSSGTRQAFESIIALDFLSNESAETSGNGDMAQQVGSNKNAIGYVSLTTNFEGSNLKALKYEGVNASVASVNQSEYQLARPFSFVTRAKGDFESQDKEDLVFALLDYIVNSKEGREFVLFAGGIVDVESGTPWNELKENHSIINQDNSHITIKTGGSTSVDKTLSKTVASFIPMAGNFKFEPNHTGSGDGYKRTIGSEKNGANSADIGFASREFNYDEDVNLGMLLGVYAKDAVVVVINKENNQIDDLSADQLNEIFTGELMDWTEIE